MGLILSLETTTTNCSVALTQDGNLLCLKENNSKKYSHAEKLHPFIKEVLEQTQHQLTDLEAIAVSKGPGSYTGLRIGVSAAKGLCFSLELPLLATDTLFCLSLQDQTGAPDFIIPMLDARRMEVYTAVFDQEGNRLSNTQAKILDENSYQSFLKKGQVLFIGNAVNKFEKICQHPHAQFVESLPSAKDMIQQAEEQYQNGNKVDLAYFEPYYLKDFLGKK